MTSETLPIVQKLKRSLGSESHSHTARSGVPATSVSAAAADVIAPLPRGSGAGRWHYRFGGAPTIHADDERGNRMKKIGNRDRGSMRGVPRRLPRPPISYFLYSISLFIPRRLLQHEQQVA